MFFSFMKNYKHVYDVVYAHLLKIAWQIVHKMYANVLYCLQDAHSHL